MQFSKAFNGAYKVMESLHSDTVAADMVIIGSAPRVTHQDSFEMHKNKRFGREFELLPENWERMGFARPRWIFPSGPTAYETDFMNNFVGKRSQLYRPVPITL